MDLTVIRYLRAKLWYIVPAQVITNDSLHYKELGFHLNHHSIGLNKIDLRQQDIYYFDTVNLEGKQICINLKDKPIVFYYSYAGEETSAKVLQLYNNYINDVNKDRFGRLNRFPFDTACVKILKQGDVIAELYADDLP